MTQVFYKLGQNGRVVETDPERVKLTNLYLSAGEYSIFGALLQNRQVTIRDFLGPG